MKTGWQQRRFTAILIFFLLLVFLIPFQCSALDLESQTQATLPEIEIGRKVYEQIRPHLRFIESPIIIQSVEHIGKGILDNLPKNRYEFRFFPIISSDINAFALSNGYIFVTNRLIQACDTEEELAFVLCHEIAHVLRGHLMKFLSQKKKIDFATLAVMILSAILSNDADLQEGLPAISLGINETLTLSYSREQENEADTYGLRYLIQSGYSVGGAIKFMEKLRVLSHISFSIPAYLSTHPMPVDRLINIQTLEPILPSKQRHPRGYSFERLKLLSHLETDLSSRMFADLSPVYLSNPNNINIIYALALAQEKMGASEEAENLFRKGLSLYPRDTDFLRDYGIFLYKRGRIKEAESKIKLVTQINPNDSVAYHYLGRIMMDQNAFDKAIESFERSVELYSEILENYNFLGILYNKKGREEKSHHYFYKYFIMVGNKEAALLHAKKSKKNAENRDENLNLKLKTGGEGFYDRDLRR